MRRPFSWEKTRTDSYLCENFSVAEPKLFVLALALTLKKFRLRLSKSFGSGYSLEVPVDKTFTWKSRQVTSFILLNLWIMVWFKILISSDPEPGPGADKCGRNFIPASAKSFGSWRLRLRNTGQKYGLPEGRFCADPDPKHWFQLILFL